MPRSLFSVSTLVPNASENLPRWRDRLQAEHRFRTEQIAILDLEMSANPQLHHDGVTLALQHAAKIALNEVNDALTRMDTGDYGHCTHCTQRIPVDRLDVLPMTAMCMPCQYQAQTRKR